MTTYLSSFFVIFNILLKSFVQSIDDKFNL